MTDENPDDEKWNSLTQPTAAQPGPAAVFNDRLELAVDYLERDAYEAAIETADEILELLDEWEDRFDDDLDPARDTVLEVKNLAEDQIKLGEIEEQLELRARREAEIRQDVHATSEHAEANSRRIEEVEAMQRALLKIGTSTKQQRVQKTLQECLHRANDDEHGKVAMSAAEIGELVDVTPQTARKYIDELVESVDGCKRRTVTDPTEPRKLLFNREKFVEQE